MCLLSPSAHEVPRSQRLAIASAVSSTGIASAKSGAIPLGERGNQLPECRDLQKEGPVGISIGGRPGHVDLLDMRRRKVRLIEKLLESIVMPECKDARLPFRCRGSRQMTGIDQEARGDGGKWILQRSGHYYKWVPPLEAAEYHHNPQ